MKYIITKITAGSPGYIEITEEKYYEIAKARDNLFEALFLEEQLDLVTENYYEYETELLSMASRMMIFQNDTYDSMSNERNIIGRRIANLMSACRMFLDQTGHHIKTIYGDESELLKKLEEEKSCYYRNLWSSFRA